MTLVAERVPVSNLNTPAEAPEAAVDVRPPIFSELSNRSAVWPVKSTTVVVELKPVVAAP